MTTKEEKVALLKMAGYVIRDIKEKTHGRYNYDWALPSHGIESDTREYDLDVIMDDAFEHLRGNEEIIVFIYEPYQSKNLLDSM